MIYEIGFVLTATTQARVLAVATFVLWLGVASEAAGAALAWAGGKRRWGGAVLTALLALALVAKSTVLARWLAAEPGAAAVRLESYYLGILQLLLLARVAYRGLWMNRALAFARVSPRVLLIGSYLGLIAVGAALLKLPRATTAPGALSWLDAFFTSTSAVCVTGLIVVDTATVFTELGQMIILGLIQLGGLGLMTFAYFFVSLLAGITLRDRAILLDYLNEENVGRITQMLVAIVVLTFAFEVAGALLLHLTSPVGARSWLDSVFHAISAFCNAGFSTYALGLYDPTTRSNLSYQSVVMVLIVVGGLGFPVLKNLWDAAWARLRHPAHRPPRLTLHTRLVLVTTAALLVGGTVAVWVLERVLNGPAAPAAGGLAATFMSVTTRTAGFNTVPIESLAAATAQVVILLMFIGGAPASTAGGMKVTTFAVALLNAVRTLRAPESELVAFGRTIPDAVATRAFALVLLAVGWCAVTSLLLMVLMPRAAPLDVIFESVSAFATVGLSRGLTPELHDAARLVLIVSMIVGRIGILYAAISMLGGHNRGRVTYPRESVVIS